MRWWGPRWRGGHLRRGGVPADGRGEGRGQAGGWRFRDAKESAKERAYRNRLESVAGLVAEALEEERAAREESGRRSRPESSDVGRQAREVVDRWLTGERAAAVRPLHWPLEFPEIMGVGGWAGSTRLWGNPPFIGGQKLTGALGTDYREYLVNRPWWGPTGRRGSVRVLPAAEPGVGTGAAYGDHRDEHDRAGGYAKVGLDQATAAGWQVYRAIKIATLAGDGCTGGVAAVARRDAAAARRPSRMAMRYGESRGARSSVAGEREAVSVASQRGSVLHRVVRPGQGIRPPAGGSADTDREGPA